MTKTFTKVRKWAEKVGAEVRDWKTSEPQITVTLPTGKKFEISQRRSTRYHSVRGMKGNAGGLYLEEVPEKGWGGYAFQEPSQDVCIEKMTEYL